jgi:hypothetical protein
MYELFVNFDAFVRQINNTAIGETTQGRKRL